MNYTYNDKTFTQEQVAKGAKLSKLSFDDYVKKICKQMFMVNVNKNKLTVKTDHEVIPHFFAEQKCKFSIPLDILKYRLIH